MSLYARERLDQIGDLLGAEEMSVIEAEVERGLERQMGKERWATFTSGGESGWREQHAEIDEELHSREEPGQDPRRLPDPPGN
jgi:hypothetical protein